MYAGSLNSRDYFQNPHYLLFLMLSSATMSSHSGQLLASHWRSVSGMSTLDCSISFPKCFPSMSIRESLAKVPYRTSIWTTFDVMQMDLFVSHTRETSTKTY
ncbi:hypothetical protein F5J12DRAFT_811646 [Pisolithus orientalis]|uniref:uncharacterized protein n=1 Tax=Pisolithus orientalis TaxID=936130 RepID=UPI002224B955|nr:uncharacterized protein F5J12DRAFT_811646 [Pisolithus orientalis]KAI6025971.1 hypothetical protein F5J12DRAFT_811646 [Pisolithus orientalis]